MPGFISVERFTSVNNKGKFLSLSFWESEEAAAGWRNQVNHRQSQKLGNDKLFDSYRISVGEIVREYTDRKRGALPPIPMNILVSIDVWNNFSHTESMRLPI